MNTRLERKAYQILLDAKRLPAPDLDRVFKEAESSKSSFSQLLVKQTLIKETDLLKIYSESLGIPFVSLRDVKVEREVIESVPVKLAWYYLFFPFARKNNKLTIAVSRLVDVNFLDEVRFGIGADVETVLATENEIEEMLRKYYGLGADTVDKIMTQSHGPAAPEPLSMSGIEVEDIEKLAENASVIQLVNQIILDAYRKGASDIHFEPYRGKVRVRYRVDGVLQESPLPAEMKKFFTAMLSRVKIMANLNIVERRLPQDGKARVKTQDQNLDLRVSSIPTPHGESLVIRILPSKMIRRLEELGFEPGQLGQFRDFLQKPHGIIFVTGPTGSGKSTTLYAGLSFLNTGEKKVITIEDPVEYELEGTTQIQVAPEIGLTFAAGLRSVLRHDPDIMMIGEVRDLETADIAIRVALTGHLILSTLHTNDAASGVTRLLDIGVEPYLVASSVNAFIAQRLVRVICPQCKKEDSSVLPAITELIRRDMQLSPDQAVPVFRGVGCDACNRTGYAGRIAIYEILPVTAEISRLIFQRVPAEEIKALARSQGMKTLRRQGWEKVFQGITTPEEVLEAAPVDEFPQISSEKVPAVSKSAAEPLPPKLEKPEFDEDLSYFSDRRAFVRRQAHLEFRFREIDVERDELKNEAESLVSYEGAVTDDISANGLSFTFEREFTPGAALDLRIQLPEGPLIACVSRVVRVMKTMNPERGPGHFLFQSGVTFLAINSTDRARLEKFCKQKGPVS